MVEEIVTTGLGKVQGFQKDGCSAFLGIPFAKPPVGEWAFRHPLPPEPWEGVLQADHGSSNPIQAPGGFYIGNNSQDCLYLNVFVPEGASAPLPVMVWIYGGAYSQGGAGAEEKVSNFSAPFLTARRMRAGMMDIGFVAGKADEALLGIASGKEGRFA